MDPLIGQMVLGRYEVLRRIGSGGMGSVYVGRQAAVQREVALKILRTDLMTNEHVRERFRREAEVIGKLHHPNTIQLIDYGETPEGLAVMVMELLVGQPLNERLREKGPLPLVQAIDIGIHVASSLAEAHLIGLVHRDLKPANIFLVEVAGQTHAKVLDFGIARILDEEATRLTSTGQVFGTPRYMSPEQAMSTGEVDSRSDIYSLGLIIYECIVGQPPFVAQTSIQYLSAHSTQTPPKLREHFADAPEALENLIDACLAKEATDRPQSADDVANALRAIKRSVEAGEVMAPMPILSAREGSKPKAPDPTLQNTGQRTEVDDKTLIKPEKRTPTTVPEKKSSVMLFAGLALVVTAGAAALLAWRLWGGETDIVVSAFDAEVVAQRVDAGLGRAIALVTDTIDAGASEEAVAVDGGEREKATEAIDAGTAEETETKAIHGKGKGRPRGKAKSKDHGGTGETGGSHEGKHGPVVATPPGNGTITGPASMVLDTGGDDKGAILQAAKSCKDSVLSGNAHLTLKGCPSNCAVIVDEKCAGRTPASGVAVSPGYRNVAVVCGSHIKMSAQAKFTADESTDLRCQ